MQTKNITVGVEYAYAKQWEWEPRDYRFGRRAHRIVVTAVKAPRDSWGNGYRPVKKNDGIEIQHVDDDGTKGQIKVVRPQEIREEWATFKPAEDKATKARSEREAQTLAEQTATKSHLDSLFALIPDVKRPWWTDRTPSTEPVKGTMYGTELVALLQAAYEAGKDAS